MLEDGSRDLSRTYSKAEGFEEPRCCFTRRPDDSRLFCCRCAHKRKASPLTCLAICFLVLTYNLLGGFLFLAIEGSATEETAVAASKPNLSQAQESSTDLRSRTVERLWSITEDLNILYKENWTKLAAKELMDFQKVLIKSHGNVTPKSSVGKLVAVAYACIGIPIIMLYLSTIGETLARNFRVLYSKICPSRFKTDNFHTKADCLNKYSLVNCEQYDCERKEFIPERQKRTPFQAALNLDSFSGGYHWTCRDHTRVPIVLSLLLIVLYISLGTFVFHTTEKWDYMEGCFFSFSSLATIGFGNLKPGLYASTLSAKAEDVALGVCCLYILVGIVVIAMCFNLIQEDMSSILRSFTALCTGSSKSRAVHSVDKICEKKIAMSVAAEAGPSVAFTGPRQQVKFKVDSLNPTKFNSLPRRKSSNYGDESFQRNTPVRRSAGHTEKCVEYFVPRSLSEFNLSEVGDLYDLSFRDKKGQEKVCVKGPGRDKMVTFEDDRPPGKALADDVFM
ncbi:Potassium channel subfamily K member [Operophtera brumata]|uniref:Potassium channel subfamily K member n=1 Tax=Operophtera brumata TaxID=104452 RepID=A0A0L7L1Z8_OPEBR|nr:Potassium channel subfamily K member [Operophtera brumata]